VAVLKNGVSWSLNKKSPAAIPLLIVALADHVAKALIHRFFVFEGISGP
jgi:hypothetical protein